MKIKAFLKKYRFVILALIIGWCVFYVVRTIQIKAEIERNNKRITESIMGVTDEDAEKALYEVYIVTEYLKLLNESN